MIKGILKVIAIIVSFLAILVTLTAMTVGTLAATIGGGWYFLSLFETTHQTVRGK